MDMGEVSTKSTKLEEVDLPQNIEVAHISPIEPLAPVYGPARSRAASLHTLNSTDLPTSSRNVEKIKINPKTNIVQDFNNENPTPSEMDFDINSV